MNADDAKGKPDQTRSIALWAGVIGAPIVWGAQFGCNYALAPWACGGGVHAAIYTVTIGAVFLTLVAAYLSWRDWRAAGGSPEKNDGGPTARKRFLGAMGLFLSLLLAMVILAQGLASAFFEGCWT